MGTATEVPLAVARPLHSLHSMAPRSPRHTAAAQRTQYPLIKEYTLNYRGLNIMI